MPTEAKLKNEIDKDLQSVLRPLNLMQDLFVMAKDWEGTRFFIYMSNINDTIFYTFGFVLNNCVNIFYSDSNILLVLKLQQVNRILKINSKHLNSLISFYWSGMATCIRKAARSILGESKGNGVIEKETWWWVEEVQSVLKEKKMKFKEWQRTEDNDDSEKARKKAEYDECKQRRLWLFQGQKRTRGCMTLDSPAGQNDFTDWLNLGRK
ncbi:uncharacterized protein LOC135118786 [Helicoverpa armigera]|uniref:uncharacterized protein LOC135118786 n=1 Tax=Helicoverpa armigera TaxID=29058 RepID=UPI003083465B